MVEPGIDRPRLPPGLDLDDSVFLVAGAGGGIGGAVTELLSTRGASLVCADVDEEACESSVEIAVQAGGQRKR